MIGDTSFLSWQGTRFLAYTTEQAL